MFLTIGCRKHSFWNGIVKNALHGMTMRWEDHIWGELRLTFTPEFWEGNSGTGPEMANRMKSCSSLSNSRVGADAQFWLYSSLMAQLSSGWRVNGWNKWESQCPIGCPPIWMISRTRTNKYNSSLYSCRAQASSSLVIGGFLHSASFLLQLQICQISLLYPQTF